LAAGKLRNSGLALAVWLSTTQVTALGRTAGKGVRAAVVEEVAEQVVAAVEAAMEFHQATLSWPLLQGILP